MNKLLTIVVPIYNVELYINKCLDSCLIYKTNEQGEKVLDEDLMNQLEVIIVNDGTPDNSAEMSREYVKHYPQTFCQIDKENGGHGSAWNVGLKEATGKYLRFLDSDDWLTNLDKLMNKLAETDVDLAFTDECVHYIEQGRTELQNCSFVYGQFLSIDNVQMLDILTDFSSLNFRRCTYRTELLRSQYPLFREHVSYDDTILFVAPYIGAKTMIAFDFVVYNLLRGREEQSMNEKVILKKADQKLQAYVDLHEYIKNHDFSNGVMSMVDSADLKNFLSCFNTIVQLEYARRKPLMKVLLANRPRKNYSFSKRIVRYMEMPFFMAYLCDELREFKANVLTK